MKRTLTALALTVALLGGGSAQAAPIGKPVVGKIDKVANCIHYLKWAHRKPTEAREDRAIVVCSRITTAKDAKRLYRWAKKPGNRWSLELIG